MKRLLVTLLLCGVGISSLAQGTVTFVNSSTSLVQLSTPSLQPLAVNGGYVELLWAPSGTPAPVSWFFSGLPLSAWLASNPGWAEVHSSITAIAPVAGRFNGGIQTLSPLSPPGSIVEALVVAWTGPFTTFDSAVANNGLVGFSAMFTIQTANPMSTPPEFPGLIYSSTSTPFTGLAMGILTVPEPSTAAFLALGALGIALLPRRMLRRPSAL